MKELSILSDTNTIHIIKIPKEATNIYSDEYGIYYSTIILKGVGFLNHYHHLGFKSIITNIAIV